MAESKPFDPTPSRLARAAREGDVAISHDAVTLLAFACALGAAFALAPSLAGGARDAIVAACTAHAPGEKVLVVCGLAVAAVAVSSMIGATAATFVQAGGPRVSALSFKLSRLSPSEGFKRAFGREAVVTLVRGLLVLALVTLGLGLLAVARFEGLLRFESLVAMVARSRSVAVEAFALVVAVGVALVAIDVANVRASRRKRLRMSFDEMRRDSKDNDGDPQLRSRRRQSHRQRSRGSMSQVSRASFVIANPTHVAIAVRYVPDETPVPEVLVRATDLAAQRVKALAARLHIPIIENVTLARALLESDLGPIDASFYLAVADIVARLARA